MAAFLEKRPPRFLGHWRGAERCRHVALPARVGLGNFIKRVVASMITTAVPAPLDALATPIPISIRAGYRFDRQQAFRFWIADGRLRKMISATQGNYQAKITAALSERVRMDRSELS